MESLIKADVFFLISSVATVVLTILISILLFYLIKAGKILYKISKALKGGFKESEEFIMELRERLENNIVFRIFFPLPKKSRKKSRK
ncbi:MAG: hypothetical protein V1819_02235 [bacterium]